MNQRILAKMSVLFMTKKVTVVKVISNKCIFNMAIVQRPQPALFFLFFRTSPLIFNYFEDIFPKSV